MSLWIKICGNTCLEDAMLATEAGADALGFVFAPSPRQVTPTVVAEICARLPHSMERIGVFVDASVEAICATVHTAHLTGVQLHWKASAELVSELKKRLAPDVRLIRVVHFGPQSAAVVEALEIDPNIDAVLVDTRSPSAQGGTGLAYDWDAAATDVFAPGHARGQRLVAAGGMTPETVAQAIRTLNPWGVDVVTGVEAEPGRKDHAKVREFIANARKSIPD